METKKRCRFKVCKCSLPLREEAQALKLANNTIDTRIKFQKLPLSAFRKKSEFYCNIGCLIILKFPPSSN